MGEELQLGAEQGNWQEGPWQQFALVVGTFVMYKYGMDLFLEKTILISPVPLLNPDF